METAINTVDFPELIIGVAGPIGVNVDSLCEAIKNSLKKVSYESQLIKLTSEMSRFEKAPTVEARPDFDSQYHSKMDRANNLRIYYKTPDIMARIGIQTIREYRKSATKFVEKPQPSFAYILRQLKLPEEVALLRRTYGRQFILVSAYASEHDRHNQLFNTLKRSLPTDTEDSELNYKASKLISRDASEEKDDSGQNLRETFHLADLFTHGLDRQTMELNIDRFFQAFFGRNDITPTKDEFGLYAAKSAALRSADLSRQVGAAIFTHDGQILTQGCNDVPRAHGGTYWDGEHPDFRDIHKGYDPNDSLKKEIVRNIVERLLSNGYLSSSLTTLGNSFSIVDRLTNKDDPHGVLADAQVMDLTEYGRVVHAEMNAICDAARTGLSIKNTILYCTTFPCHNCTKHIISTGVNKVVFLEPYPKSKAHELFADEIQIESDSDPLKVAFVPFLGISPFRYRDIFQKGKRKKAGQAQTWYHSVPKPLLEIEFPSYPIAAEKWAIAPLLGEVQTATQPGTKAN